MPAPTSTPIPAIITARGRWEEIAGAPEVAFIHSVLLPDTHRVLYWGYTAPTSRESGFFDAGRRLHAAGQPARRVAGPRPEHVRHVVGGAYVLEAAQRTVLIHGGFSPDKAFAFDPAALTWTRVGGTTHDRFYATTLTLANGTAMTLYGNHRSYEI